MVTDALHADIGRLEQLLYDKKKQLQDVYRACKHEWALSFTPIYCHAYTIPGDPPGTMGVDRQFDCHVPEKTVNRWTRICNKCGKVETTERTEQVATPGQIPGTVSQTLVPAFER